jgi:hypothetical protein
MVTRSEDSPDKPAAKTGYGFGGFLLKAAILFVVIAGGVAPGFLVANRLSRRDVAGGFDFGPSNLLNQTALAMGDSLPDISIRDGRDSTVALTPLVAGHKAVLAFVSFGCEPCEDLIEFLADRGVTGDGPCRVVLLAAGVQGYEAPGFDVFRVDRPTIDDLEIRIFPTVIGLNPDGRVAFISSGFSRVMTAPVIDKYL